MAHNVHPGSTMKWRWAFLAVSSAVLAGATALDLKRTAIQDGMKTLRQSGLEKVAQKMSTLEEVLRVTMAD